MKRYALLFLFSLSLFALYHTHTHAAVRQNEYLTNILVTHLDSTSKTITIEILNQNVLDEETYNLNVQKDIHLVVPDKNTPVFNVLDCEYEVFQNTESAGVYSKNAPYPDIQFPDSTRILTYTYSGKFRDAPLARLIFRPRQTIPGKAGSVTLVIKRLKVRLQFSHGVSDPLQTIESDDPYLTRISAQLVDNPQDLGRFCSRSESETIPKEQILQWAEFLEDALTSGPVIKISVYDPGMYGISYEEIKECGIRPEELTPNSLRLYRNGKEIPMLVTGSMDAFTRKTSLYFYVPEAPSTTPYETGWHKAYWLLTKEDPHNPPLRMTHDAKKRSSFSQRSPSIHTGTTTFSQHKKLLYWPTFDYSKYSGRWYWKEIRKGYFDTVAFELPPVAPESKTVMLTVAFNDFEHRREKSFALYLNGRLIKEDTWKTPKTYETDIPVDAALLKEGLNTLALYNNGLEKRFVERIAFVGFEISYESILQHTPGYREYTLDKITTPSVQQIFIENPGSTSFGIFDITSPEAPIVVKEPSYRTMKASSRELFYEDLEKPRRYAVCSSLSAKTPSRISLFKKSEALNPSNTADFLVIAHERFIPTLKPFVESRREEGFKVNVMDIEDVYNYFSYGNKTHVVIKDCLSFAFHQWQAPRLAYIVLVGESSDYQWDPNKRTPGIQEDLVPVWGFAQSKRGIHGDTEFTKIAGDDGIPDLALGRFSVNSTKDLEAIINKMDRYKAKPVGAWKANYIFATDDDASFSDITDSIILDSIPKTIKPVRIYEQNYKYIDFFRNFPRKRAIGATETLLSELNKGVLMMLFFGHGGPNLWTGERLFHQEDLRLLHNIDTLSFVLCASCDNAWLDYPTEPVRSAIGERFVNSPHGGAVALFGPTTGATPHQHKVLMTHLNNALFKMGLTRLGDATTVAKILYMIEKRGSSVIDQYVLIGDPSLALNVPQQSSELTLSPPLVNKLQGDAVSLSTNLPSDLWGWMNVNVIRKNDLQVMHSDTLRIFGGQIMQPVRIPPGWDEGSYIVQAFSYNLDQGREFLSTGEFEVASHSVDVAISLNSPPVITEGEVPVLTLSARNTGKVRIPGGVLVLKDSDTDAIIVSQDITLEPGERKTPDINLKPPPSGVHNLEVEFHSPPNLGDKVEARAATKIKVRPSTRGLYIASSPGEISISPDELDESQRPTITVSLHNLGTEDSPSLRAELQIPTLDFTSLSSIGAIARGQNLDLEFELKNPLPAGTHPLLFSLFKDTPLPGGQSAKILSINKQFTVLRKPDLIILPESLRFSEEKPVVGNTLYIYATVKNIGGKRCERAMVKAYLNHAGDSTYEIKPHTSYIIPVIEELDAGEEREVTFRWDSSPLGIHKIFVRVNPDRTVDELNFANNTVSKEIEFYPHGNMLFEGEVKSSHTFVRDNTLVDVEYTIKNIGYEDVGPVTIDLDTRNEGRLPERYGEKILIDEIKRDQTVSLATQWKVRQNRNIFGIRLNQHRDFFEGTFDDNDYELKCEYVLPLARLLKESDTTYSFKPALLTGIWQGISVTPAFVLTTGDFSEQKGDRIYVESKHLTTPLPTPEIGSSPENDHQWSIRWAYLSSHPKEDAPPIQISIPVPQEQPSNVFDVYVWTITESNHKGYPASKFRLKIEGQSAFTDYDFTRDEFPNKVRRYYIGRHVIDDTTLDVTVDDSMEKVWAIVMQFEFVPILSTYRSPVVELGNRYIGKTIVFSAESINPAPEHIHFYMRSGKPMGKNDFIWSRWKRLEFDERGQSTPVPLIAEAIQWKVELVPDKSGSAACGPVSFSFLQN